MAGPGEFVACRRVPPTGFWCEGEHLYWHGSSASRTIRFQKPGVIWAARYPVHQTLGAADPCPRQHPDAVMLPEMAPYRPGRRLDDVLTENYQANHPSD